MPAIGENFAPPVPAADLPAAPSRLVPGDSRPLRSPAPCSDRRRRGAGRLRRARLPRIRALGRQGTRAARTSPTARSRCSAGSSTRWRGWGWRSRPRAGPKAVKSARVVGDVLGRFHPHGDQAAYDAMVRMAQDFALRYPLIDGQGNFGSRDGDGAAAMRYTEARLAPIARLLLDEIDEGTVEFIANYDGSTEEPRLLPARLPFVLLNGASGIAVGLATEIPSHNLREVAAAAIALLKDDKLDDDALAALLPGPDYPGGGQIISPPEDIRAAYATGRGSLKVRARWKIEDLARGQWQLVVTELPPGTSAQKVLEEIEELTNPKVKAGKKALSAEQLQLKASVLAVLDAVRDESSKDAAVRLVFEPKSRTVAQADLVNALLAHTSLESSAPINLTMVGADGRPTQKSLLQLLGEWNRFRARDRRAALAPSAGQGRRPDPHPRRAPARPAPHRRGDRDHPRRRRAEGGADRALHAQRAPGRRHPRHPPAPAGAARGDQDRAGAEGAARRGGEAERDPRQPGGAQAHRDPRDRGRRQGARRRAPDADRGRQARRRRGPRRRRAGHGRGQHEGLGAGAEGPRGRGRPARLQGRRRDVRHVRMPQRRLAARLRQQRPRLLGRRGEPAERARRRPADHLADRPRAGNAAGALLRRRAVDGAAARRHGRLRPARARRRPAVAPARRQGLPRSRRRRQAAAAGDRRRDGVARRLPDACRAAARVRPRRAQAAGQRRPRPDAGRPRRRRMRW